MHSLAFTFPSNLFKKK